MLLDVTWCYLPLLDREEARRDSDDALLSASGFEEVTTCVHDLRSQCPKNPRKNPLCCYRRSHSSSFTMFTAQFTAQNPWRHVVFWDNPLPVVAFLDPAKRSGLDFKGRIFRLQTWLGKIHEKNPWVFPNQWLRNNGKICAMIHCPTDLTTDSRLGWAQPFGSQVDVEVLKCGNLPIETWWNIPRYITIDLP